MQEAYASCMQQRRLGSGARLAPGGAAVLDRRGVALSLAPLHHRYRALDKLRDYLLAHAAGAQ